VEEDAQAGPTAGTGRLFDCPWSLRSTAQTVLSFADTDSPWRARCEVRGMRSLAPAVRGRLEGWWVQMFSLVLVVSAVTCLSASRATALTAPAIRASLGALVRCFTQRDSAGVLVCLDSCAVFLAVRYWLSCVKHIVRRRA